VLFQIPDPRAPSQTCPPLPFSSQGGSPPRSAICGSPPATPAGPGSRDPPWPTPLRTSSRAGHFPKDGAIAVPSAARPQFRRASSLHPRAVTHFGSARIVRGVRRAWFRPGRWCLGRETWWNENRDTRRGDESSRQLAVGSGREAKGGGVSIGRLGNWSIGERRTKSSAQRAEYSGQRSAINRAALEDRGEWALGRRVNWSFGKDG